MGPIIAGSRSPALIAFYVVFALLYSLWALRLTLVYSADRRLGYLLAVGDCAVLLPLAAWGSGLGLKVLVCLVAVGGGMATIVTGVRTRPKRVEGPSQRIRPPTRATVTSVESWDPKAGLEAALRARLRVFNDSGARFGLVMLRVVRFEEAESYYGRDAAQRMLSVIGRRGIRLLGQDGQRFPLTGGRIAFLFGTEDEDRRPPDQETTLNWTSPYDVEGLAMSLGRKVCEHLVDGHRVECVVGWASAPANGLSAEDLLETALSGSHSTAAFRRVSGPRVAARVVRTSGPLPSASAPEQKRAVAG
jgi:hypothetical protein